MLKNKRRIDTNALAALSASALAAIVGLLLALVVLLVCDSKNAMPGFLTLITGGIREGGIKAVGDILYQATPIMMCGAGIAVAFKASVFNIGGGGQFLVGAFVGIYGAIKWDFLPGALRWIVPLIAAAASGALWALIPGLLKAFRNVNIVISTIMMNYLARYLVNSLIKASIFNSAKNETLPIPAEASLPRIGLDKLFPGSSANIGILITIVVCILIWVLINKTTFGYELRACGLNDYACKYAGIKEKRTIVVSIMISGALIALGGALMYMAGTGKCIKVYDTQPAEGFTGISISVLANNSPLGVILSSLFIAFLTIGGQYIQSYGFVKEIVNIVTSAVIYLSAFTLLLRIFFDTAARKRQAKHVQSHSEKGA
ncbi:MAG: ABC transporter permease [Oscillospiraceae bacterium]|nr:ABC transporter permease [Oscillospiraceae bacterium]